MVQPSIFHAKLAAANLIKEGVDCGRKWAQVAVDSGDGLALLLKECSLQGAAVLVGMPRQLPATLSATTVVFADLSHLTKVVEHRQSDQVISVECGMTVGQLDAFLEKSGQWWPVAAAADDTIYDIIARGDGGWLEHGFGGPRHLVLGLEVALPNGKLIKMGGKVVKNVTGYDVTKLLVGARSTLGLPVLAHLRLFARPQQCGCLIVKSSRLEDLLLHACALLSSGLPIAALEIMHAASAAHEDKAGPDWLKEFGAGEDTFLSIVQVFEHEEVVTEVLTLMQSLTASHMVQHVRRPPVASQLNNTSAAANGVEISCPMSVVAEIVSLARQCACADGLWLRPGSGRLRFALPAPHDLEVFRVALTKMCRDTGRTLTMAVSEGDTFQVRHLPQPDDAACGIIASIKMQFDPKGCLNPCASF